MIKSRKITYTISAILILSSITAITLWGFNLGIDFTGGTNWYGDGRDHAWYFLDNLTYNEANAVPEPSTFALMCLGLAVWGYGRKRHRS